MNTHLCSSLISLRAAWVSTCVALVSTVLLPATFAAGKPGGDGGSGTPSVPAEARIPIGPDTTPGDADSSPSLYKITQPGSYFLTGNLTGVSGKHGIEVAANRVTIDLNGYTLQGVDGSLDGINISELFAGLSVRNGAISGWRSGIYAAYDNGRFADLLLMDNTQAGLWAGTAVITDCTASGNGLFGIRAVSGAVVTRVLAHHNQMGISLIGGGVRLVDSSARANTGLGIQIGDNSNILVGVSSLDNGGNGFECGWNSTLERCTAKNNNGTGFILTPHSTVSHCSSFFNNGSGYKLYGGVIVSESTADSNTVDGFESLAGNIRVDNCVASLNGQNGFSLKAGSQIRGSLARSNGLHGLAGEGNCQIVGNHAILNGTDSNTGAGIYASGSGNHVENNTCNGNDTGFSIVSGDNLVIRNTARGNSLNYNFASGTEYGQVVNNPGAGFVNTNAWANIGY